jgi:hypothetical protein
MFDLNGPILQLALSEQPSLSLDFYSYGCVLRKREGETIIVHPIDSAVVLVLHPRIRQVALMYSHAPSYAGTS